MPGGGPQKVGVPIVDILTGMYSATGVISALLHRERTGEGQHIDMALLDVQVSVLANQNMNYPHDRNAAEALRQCASEHRSLSGVQNKRRFVRAGRR